MQRLQPIADDHGLTIAQLSLAWVLNNNNIAGAIIGASRPEQVTQNTKAFGVKLSADVLQAIDEVILPFAETDPAKTLENAPQQRPS